MTFHKYPKIVRFGGKETEILLENPNDIIYFEEKIDGANFRFMPTEDGRIIFGSRTQSIGDSTRAEESFHQKNNWSKCVQFILNALKNKDLKPYTGYIFYGECCIPHSIQYNWDTMPPFIGYDIMKDDKFIDYYEKCKIFSELGLPVVNSFMPHEARDVKNMSFTDADVPNSIYGSVQAEGFVLKNYRTQTFLKFVCTKFKEVNKTKFGGNKKFASDDNERLIDTFCTNPRIDKQIFKLVDDGNELNIKLMQFLPSKVWDDIVEEHSEEILHKDWKLDIRACRKSVSKRCLGVLEQVIQLQNLVE